MLFRSFIFEFFPRDWLELDEILPTLTTKTKNSKKFCQKSAFRSRKIRKLMNFIKNFLSSFLQILMFLDRKLQHKIKFSTKSKRKSKNSSIQPRTSRPKFHDFSSNLSKISSNFARKASCSWLLAAETSASSRGARSRLRCRLRAPKRARTNPEKRTKSLSL